ncbi:hypothetical protein U9M48_041538, partial [Paspalum notatum var. saurae]
MAPSYPAVAKPPPSPAARRPPPAQIRSNPPMVDPDAARLLKIPPPIHSDVRPAGCPPPGSILLDPYGNLSARTNGTTTVDGKRILVTLLGWAAVPPRVSCFTVHCPDDWKPFALGDLPAVLCSDADLVLLRVTASSPTSTTTSSTRPAPTSACRLRGDSFYCLAVLLRVFGRWPYNDDLFSLHLDSSKTGRWSTRRPSMLIHIQAPCSPLEGELGSVGFVDLWRGYPHLRSPPLVPKPPKGYAPYIRNIVDLEGYIKFFEMRNLAGRRAASSNSTCAASQGGWVAATKKMVSSISRKKKEYNAKWFHLRCCLEISERNAI